MINAADCDPELPPDEMIIGMNTVSTGISTVRYEK
ncbi:MAG: hypothetical protein BWZ08_01644 [candidate division BRC1 bacterium ADurb.BinA292]|nr:MAG: hypothetical protein BWZ08_01644 [candidate division BRC1 bacterium ADurb.BinA292]